MLFQFHKYILKFIWDNYNYERSNFSKCDEQLKQANIKKYEPCIINTIRIKLSIFEGNTIRNIYALTHIMDVDWF